MVSAVSWKARFNESRSRCKLFMSSPNYVICNTTSNFLQMLSFTLGGAQPAERREGTSSHCISSRTREGISIFENKSESLYINAEQAVLLRVAVREGRI